MNKLGEFAHDELTLIKLVQEKIFELILTFARYAL